MLAFLLLHLTQKIRQRSLRAFAKTPLRERNIQTPVEPEAAVVITPFTPRGQQPVFSPEEQPQRLNVAPCQMPGFITIMQRQYALGRNSLMNNIKVAARMRLKRNIRRIYPRLFRLTSALLGQDRQYLLLRRLKLTRERVAPPRF